MHILKFHPDAGLVSTSPQKSQKLSSVGTISPSKYSPVLESNNTEADLVKTAVNYAWKTLSLSTEPIHIDDDADIDKNMDNSSDHSNDSEDYACKTLSLSTEPIQLDDNDDNDKNMDDYSKQSNCSNDSNNADQGNKVGDEMKGLTWGNLTLVNEPIDDLECSSNLVEDGDNIVPLPGYDDNLSNEEHLGSL